MRTLIVSLILANLAFAAWALLIDRPVEAPAARDISHLPKLMLAGEAPVPGATAAGDSAPISSVAAARCVTVGPFSDLAAAATASALLQSRGLTPTQRDESGADVVAYWVYLDNVPSDAAAARLLQRLHNNGVADAHVMPVAAASEPRRVSVGLFNEHAGAERRARQVTALGLTPLITEQHHPQATYWINIALTSAGQSVSTEGMLPAGAAETHLEIRACPVAASSAPISSQPTP